MAAPALNLSKNQQTSWNESPAGSALAPLLDLALLQAHARGAYVYRFDRVVGQATLVAFAGPHPDAAALKLSSDIAPLHWNRKTPVVLRTGAASDWRFADFPEFRSGRFDGVISVPLVESAETVGVVNFCREGDSPLGGGSLSLLMGLSLPMGTLLVASTLRDRLRKASQDLADRKVFERAKGLLQSRFQWTEEEAYLRMRRLSRRCRTPLREIAQLVIESRAEVMEAND